MTSPLARRVIAVLIIVIGAAMLAYNGWAVQSDRAAARRYFASGACTSFAPRPAPQPDCTWEDAVVTRKDVANEKGGSGYFFVVNHGSNTRDRARIGWSTTGHTFWNLHRVGDTISVQRFASPGYHLSGRISMVRDDRATVPTLDSPATTRSAPLNFIMGVITIITGLVVLRVRRPDSPL